MSDFVRSFLTDPIHEKYAMGGPLLPPGENFVGAEYVLGLHEMTIELCRDIFGVRYADPRPLSGTASVTALLMTLSEPGQRIGLQTAASGGHASMAPICRRLGLEIIDLPYNFERFQFEPVHEVQLDFALLAPSEILYAPPLDALAFDSSTVVVYDATQTLGLIASGHLPSPFRAHPRVVVSAGTHKTLPGPSSGLLLTNDDQIAARVDSELSPKFVRHSHPHHTASLCAALIEQQATGYRYSARILEHTTTLSRSLSSAGLDVLQDDDRVSQTHQVFVHVAADRLDAVYERALAAGITLNAKRKRLFHHTGLRLGVQELARYRWTESDIERLGRLLNSLVRGDASVDRLRIQVREFAELNEFDPTLCLPAD
jgi:glycine/serine hydroxymethyltransferase